MAREVGCIVGYWITAPADDGAHTASVEPAGKSGGYSSD
jgi:hypothetical protein